MAEIDHPRFLNDAISTSSSGVNIEAGLLLHAGVVLVDHQRQGEPTPTGGCSEVGRFSEQLWGDPRERGQGGAMTIQTWLISISPEACEVMAEIRGSTMCPGCCLTRRGAVATATSLDAPGVQEPNRRSPSDTAVSSTSSSAFLPTATV